MQLAMIGLGKMGGNMSARLLSKGHEVVGYDAFNESAIAEIEERGGRGAHSLEEIRDALSPPRVVWLMIPSGDPTEETIQALIEVLDPDDILIDGGNSNYTDSLRRAELLRQTGLQFVDVGVSGGVWGLEQGYSMMIGGDPQVVKRLDPIFEALAPDPQKGWGHVGPSGAGHFTKMIHNGIEYGLMQAYAEGFAILKAKDDFDLDVHQIAEIWRFGTVIRSWLLDLTSLALQDDPDLADIKAWVDDSGEGRWTVAEAIDQAVPAPVISAALFSRFRSRREGNYADKLLAAMRQQFGGHAVRDVD